MADLVNWLLGGDAARRELLEHEAQGPSQHAQLDNQPHRSPGATATQQVELAQQNGLRRMHELLAARLGQEFPGQRCQICGKGLIFERLAVRRAYSLACPNRCADTLVLPEELLLKSLQNLPVARPQPDP